MKSQEKTSKPAARHHGDHQDRKQGHFFSPGADQFFFNAAPVQAVPESEKEERDHYNDPLEKEADQTARKVTNGIETRPAQKADEDSGDVMTLESNSGSKDEESDSSKKLSETSNGSGGIPGSVDSGGSGGSNGSGVSESSNGSLGSDGKPLPEGLRSEFEAGMGADFSDIRVHTGPEAARMSEQAGARAFTYGKDIYFNRGEYDEQSQEGRYIIAHELTHTIQQGAAPSDESYSKSPEQVQPIVDTIRRGVSRIGRVLGFSDAIGTFISWIPGYDLFSLVIGYDVIRRRDVDMNAENLLRGLLGLIPGVGLMLFDKLQELEILQDAFSWVRDQLDDLRLNRERIEDTLQTAWDEVSIRKGISGNKEVLDRTFGRLIRDIEEFAGRVRDAVITFIRDALVTALHSFAMDVPGYSLLTKVIGRDPIINEDVDASTVEIIEDFLILINREEELEKMHEEGTVQETADWIDEQLAELDFSFEEVRELFTETWQSFSIDDVRDPVGAFRRTVAIWNPLLTRISNFAVNVAEKVLKFIKNALLSALSDFAHETRGYYLLTVIIARDIFTGKYVPRSVENIIRGFMSLMSGGLEQYNEMKETGVIQQASDRINDAVDSLGFTFDYLQGLFLELWESFTIQSLMEPLAAFQRIVDTIAAPIGRLIRFIITIVRIILEVFLAIMKFPVDIITEIIDQVSEAWDEVKSRPVNFIKNLLLGVKEGFSNFFDNISTHLLGGLTDWLFRELDEAGIDPPADLSFRSIFGLVVQILGITVERIWDKVKEAIGPEKAEKLEAMADQVSGAWSFVKDIFDRGPVAIWEYVQEQLSNLWDMVFGAVRDWVMKNIVQKVTARLLTMLDPSGVMAVINSFIAMYRAIESFVAYLTEMLETVNRFVGGVLAIAKGNIMPAAERLENALSNAMPIAIGFLANQVGLRNVGKKIGEIVESIQGHVDKALDWLIERAMAAGSAMMEMGRSAAGAIRDWWSDRRPVQMQDGSRHELYFSSSGPGADVMMASSPQTYESYLNNLRDEHNIPEESLSDARNKVRQINELIAQNVPEDQQEEHGKRINDRVHELVDLTKDLPLPEGEGTNTPPVYGPLRQGFGSYALVDYLQSPHDMGSSPSVSGTPEFDLINLRKSGEGSYYVKGHLLNDHLGGPGDTWKNLTPLTRSANSAHESDFEQHAKMAVNGQRSGIPSEKQGHMIDFSVVAEYNRSLPSVVKELENPEIEVEDISGFRDEWKRDQLARIIRAEQYVPTKLICNAELFEKVNHKTEKIDLPEKVIDNDIDHGDLRRYSLDASPREIFRFSDHAEKSNTEEAISGLQTLNLIGPTRAAEIVKSYRERGQMYNYKAQLGISKEAIEEANPGYEFRR